MNLIKSEWRKLVYARANWGLLIAATLISVLSVVVTPFILESQGEMFGLTLDSTEAVDSVYANGISGYVFAIIIGILLMAGEFRHGTAVATFLTSPKRGAVVANKLAIAAIAGVLVMWVSTALSMAAGWVTLQTFETAGEPSENLVLNTFMAATIGGAVLGIIGVAIGTLVRNQMMAIVGSLIYLFIIDPLLLALWPDAGKWLPSGLITAMLALDIDAPELGFDTTNYLAPLTAASVLLGFGVVFAALAITTSLRRDVE
jgi:ABC-type transport system involved in multi-copper enzyme maturation permease subunit